MSKSAYFDMCDQLKQDPLDEEIPVELDDFPEFVQSCVIIYSKLTDVWDTMNGAYLGKDYNLAFTLFALYDIESQNEQILAFELLQVIDTSRSKVLKVKMDNKNK